MKALSIHPEHARAILAGTKTEEYRSWPTSHRGPLVVHSCKKDGFLLCLVDVVDCVEDVYEGYVWLLANVRPVERVAIKGRLGLWDVEDALVRPLQVEAEKSS